jgi:uncharacterized membrane protein
MALALAAIGSFLLGGAVGSWITLRFAAANWEEIHARARAKARRNR